MSSDNQHWRAPERRDEPEIAPKPASDEDERWRPHRPSETPIKRATEPKPVERDEEGAAPWRPPEHRRPATPEPSVGEPGPAKPIEGEHWQAPPKDIVPLEQSFVAERAAQQRAAVWVDRSTRTVPILDPIVAAEGLARDYPMGETIVHALKPVEFQIGRGALVAVHGRSGSGKTTMLNLIGALDRPSAGRVWIDGEEVTSLHERELVSLRRYKIGFIFQTFGLIPILTAAENVGVPLRLARVDVAERDERVRVLLELVGLGERARHRPHELSGGEQQRVAIARALANSPRLLIADEPTGQLDSGTGRTIMTLIRALVKSEGVTAIVATHDPLLIDLADRIIELRDGEIVADSAVG
ncbi:MAG TPA: ATP-binding cassette domain-containing protein [Nitrolancea sp.]